MEAIREAHKATEAAELATRDLRGPHAATAKAAVVAARKNLELAKMRVAYAREGGNPYRVLPGRPR